VVAEQLYVISVFEALFWCYLGRGQFAGRNITIFWYLEVLDASPMGGKERSRLKHLLALLGARGFAVGDDYFDVDGVHGWLYEAETADLVELLRAIDLPRFPASFPAMEGLQAGEHGRYQPPDGYSFEALGLAFLRTVGELAMAQNLGVALAMNVDELERGARFGIGSNFDHI